MIQRRPGAASTLPHQQTFAALAQVLANQAQFQAPPPDPDLAPGDVWTETLAVTVEPNYAGDTAQFSADLAPDDLTLPYTYTIHLDGTTLVYPQVGRSAPFTFSHTFPATGTYTVEVAVWNCGLGQAGAATDTLEVEVVERGDTGYTCRW